LVGLGVGTVKIAYEPERCFEMPLDDVELEFEDTEAFFDVACSLD
jgi:hypothetical protein